jgi:hypothetical protein
MILFITPLLSPHINTPLLRTPLVLEVNVRTTTNNKNSFLRIPMLEMQGPTYVESLVIFTKIPLLGVYLLETPFLDPPDLDFGVNPQLRTCFSPPSHSCKLCNIQLFENSSSFMILRSR